MPSNITLPFARNSRYSRVVDYQLSMSQPLKKQLWKRIVKQKINNQAKVLELRGIDESKRLALMAHDVKSGDSDNREALAARIYFPLLKPGYIRAEASPTTSILNYGYAVIRSNIARSVVSHGFITSVGLHHANERNEFNLVDDLIEPFRPMVDLQMLSIDLQNEDPDNLSRKARQEMTSVLRANCCIEGKRTTCLIAIEHMVISLKEAIEYREPSRLMLPETLGIERED